MKTKNKIQNMKGIIFLSIFVVVLTVFCSGMIKSELCYQETANQSTAGDGTCSLYYSGLYACTGTWSATSGCNKTYDGNWSSYGTATGGIPGNVAYLFINYTKPSGAVNSSLWRIESVEGNQNLTIPSAVWDQSVLQFMVGSFNIGVSPGNIWYGWNGTAWVTILSNVDLSSAIYEEAMWWNVTDTCTYGGAGDWIVNAADNCNITTDTSLESNTLYIQGTGTFTILANITVDKLVMDLNAQIINKAGDGNALIIKL